VSVGKAQRTFRSGEPFGITTLVNDVGEEGNFGFDFYPLDEYVVSGLIEVGSSQKLVLWLSTTHQRARVCRPANVEQCLLSTARHLCR
jgi:hypothetical protein